MKKSKYQSAYVPAASKALPLMHGYRNDALVKQCAHWVSVCNAGYKGKSTPQVDVQQEQDVQRARRQLLSVCAVLGRHANTTDEPTQQIALQCALELEKLTDQVLWHTLMHTQLQMKKTQKNSTWMSSSDLYVWRWVSVLFCGAVRRNQLELAVQYVSFLTPLEQMLVWVHCTQMKLPTDPTLVGEKKSRQANGSKYDPVQDVWTRRHQERAVHQCSDVQGFIQVLVDQLGRWASEQEESIVHQWISTCAHRVDDCLVQAQKVGVHWQVDQMLQEAFWKKLYGAYQSKMHVLFNELSGSAQKQWGAAGALLIDTLSSHPHYDAWSRTNVYSFLDEFGYYAARALNTVYVAARSYNTKIQQVEQRGSDFGVDEPYKEPYWNARRIERLKVLQHDQYEHWLIGMMHVLCQTMDVKNQTLVRYVISSLQFEGSKRALPALMQGCVWDQGCPIQRTAVFFFASQWDKEHWLRWVEDALPADQYGVFRNTLLECFQTAVRVQFKSTGLYQFYQAVWEDRNTPAGATPGHVCQNENTPWMQLRFADVRVVQHVQVQMVREHLEQQVVLPDTVATKGAVRL